MQQIQNELPKARVVYCSATGVSEVGNMAFMSRLVGAPQHLLQLPKRNTNWRGIYARVLMSQRKLISMKQRLCFSALYDEHQEDSMPTFSRLLDECWMVTTSIPIAALLGDKVSLHSDSTVGHMLKELS